jgi:histidinol-phosphatase
MTLLYFQSKTITNILYMQKNIQTRIDFAMQISKKLSKYIFSFYQSSNIDIKEKQDETLVTKVDKESELIFRKEIEKYFPQDDVIGEEIKNNINTENEFIWTVDPIDGTYSFAHGMPLFGSMISLIHNKEIIFGIVSFPALNEMIYAIKGQGCLWKKANSENLVKSEVRTTSELKKALLCYTDTRYFIKNNCLNLLENLSQQAYDTKSWGDCFGNIMVATGRSDIMIDPMLGIWDIAPLKIIVEESGGLFIDRKTKQPVELDLTKLGVNNYNAITICSEKLLDDIFRQLNLNF